MQAHKVERVIFLISNEKQFLCTLFKEASKTMWWSNANSYAIQMQQSAAASRPISLAGNSQGVVLELNFISLPPSDKCKMLWDWGVGKKIYKSPFNELYITSSEYSFILTNSGFSTITTINSNTLYAPRFSER